MELRVLRYFLAVAREETISRASDVLHITQPTLSRQLNQLEEELGVTLFSHQGQRIVLTSDGLLLRRRAEEILELVDKTEEELNHSEDSIMGTVVLGYGEIQAMTPLADCISAFGELYPNVRFSLYSGTADDIKDRMDRGLVDVGLLMEPISVEKYDFLRTQTEEIMAVFLRPDDPLARLDAVRPEDLAGKPLILPNRFQNTLRNWMGCQFSEENVRFIQNLPTMGAILTAMGRAYMLSIEGALPFRDPARLTAVPLLGMEPLHSILAWKRGQPFSAATEAFLAHAKHFFGERSANPGDMNAAGAASLS